MIIGCLLLKANKINSFLRLHRITKLSAAVAHMILTK